MIDTTIIFSIRNRAQELAVSLPTILSKYSQDDTELVIMDDKSTDGSKDLCLALLAHHKWLPTNYTIYDSNRQDSGYDLSQAHQTNMLVEKARGKYILLQSAEVAHIDPVIPMLKKYCLPSQPSFATVYNAPAREGMMLKNAARLDPPFFGTLAAGHPECVIFGPQDLTLNGIDRYPNQKVIFKDGTSLMYGQYTGNLRIVPLFFCGMILKSDWLRLGGYKPELPTDMHFWEAMRDAGFNFAFTKTVALHITHGRS